MPLKPLLKVLALDTSTLRESVSLLHGAAVVAEFRSCSQETHSARLLNSINYLLEQSGWSLADVQLVAAGIGPGSFTGIRIGVSTALGFAQTLGCPFSGISCLDALAHEIRFVDGRLGIVMDAQRGQVYFAEYRVSRGRVRILRKPLLLTPLELESQLGRHPICLAGDGATRYLKELKLSRSNRRRLISTDLFLAAGIGRLAQERKRSWRTGEYLHAEPLYIRPPDATRKSTKVR